MANSRPKLRIITYMCPSHPVELYELILQYLEEETGCQASLLYESRSPGQLSDRLDPFTDDSADIGESEKLQGQFFAVSNYHRTIFLVQQVIG
jgi:hypothetical protein